MIEDVVVFSSVAFAVVFFVAWVVSPALRASIERPKYGFQANVQKFDLKRNKESV